MITCKFENGGEAGLRHIVVHALTLKEGKVLLVKRSEKIIEGGKWAFPGGFIGRDETAQQAVLRELKEETGWDGKIISLFRINSNPDRPNDDGRQNIPLEFIVEPTEKTGEEDWEQTEVKWFAFDEAEKLPLAFDQGDTFALLRQFQNGEIPLPITQI